VIIVEITFTSAAATALPLEYCEQVTPITDRLVLQYEDAGFLGGLQLRTTMGDCVLHQIALSSSGTALLPSSLFRASQS
jgi:hypothetical protein